MTTAQAQVSAQRETLLTELQSLKSPCVFGEGGMHEYNEKEFALSQHQLTQYAESRQRLQKEIRSANRKLGLPRNSGLATE